jgi:deoxyhypusine synthase
MESKEKEKIARENILRESEEAKGLSVKGYDFNNGIDYEKIIDSYATSGAQATNLSRAIQIIREMRKNKAFIYLGYTSNMVTGGLREIFKFLVQHKLVDAIVTTAGGIEEDIIKCLGDFKIGSFNESGEKLRNLGINRAGNILISNSRYCKFEEFIIPLLEKQNEKQKETGEIITPTKLIHLLGKEIKNEDSIYYWAEKNKIPVFCPAITDGSIGDMIYFFKSKHPEFKLDISEDIVEINNSTIGKEKTGMIILGGGIIKHHICNANLFRNGADYAVYINHAQEFDGSDAGASPDEAVSWGKITIEAKTIKVHGDASILFPLIVAKTFAKEISINNLKNQPNS